MGTTTFFPNHPLVWLSRGPARVVIWLRAAERLATSTLAPIIAHGSLTRDRRSSRGPREDAELGEHQRTGAQRNFGHTSIDQWEGSLRAGRQAYRGVARLRSLKIVHRQRRRRDPARGVRVGLEGALLDPRGIGVLRGVGLPCPFDLLGEEQHVLQIRPIPGHLDVPEEWRRKSPRVGIRRPSRGRIDSPLSFRTPEFPRASPSSVALTKE